MYGFPEENIEDLKDTLQLIIKAVNRGIRLDLLCCTLYAGTELFEQYKNKMFFDHSCQCSSMGFIYRLDYCKQLITDNPEIFSHFYETTNPTRGKYEYLGCFITQYYQSLHTTFEATVNVLLDYYNNDLLDFYSDFFDVIPDFPIIAYKSDFFVSGHIYETGIIKKTEKFIGEKFSTNLLIKKMFKRDMDKWLDRNLL